MEKGEKNTCEVQILGAEGDACDGTLVDGFANTLGSATSGERVVVCDAAQGLFCPFPTGGACTRLRDVGGSCYVETARRAGFSDDACPKGTYCDAAAKSCLLTKNARQECTQEKECGDDLFCDDVSKTCTPKRADGEACTRDTSCRGRLCEKGICRGSSRATTTFCR
jgi:hypothetical protein